MNLVPTPFQREVASRFGLVPNFFVAEPDAPEIVERLWAFAVSAYFDNPIPSLFKERLFVYLSRFCEVRYCIIRHCAFLLGYGHSAGDPAVDVQSVEQVLRLLSRSTPWERGRDNVAEALKASPPAPTGRRPRAIWKTSYSAPRRLFSLREAVLIRLAQPSATF